MDDSIAEQVLRALDPLVGEWDLVAGPAGGEPWPARGRVTFEWLPSHRHLLQRATVDVPQAPDSVCVIGCDGANGTYYQLYSDDRGVCRVYQMAIAGSEWRLWRDGPPFSQRFRGKFSDDGNVITGRWELAEDGTAFRPDIDVTYRRV